MIEDFRFDIFKKKMQGKRSGECAGYRLTFCGMCNCAVSASS